MQPGLVVVALNEGEEFRFPVGDIAPGRGGRPLEFEGGEEALGHGIVPAVAFATHALQRLGIQEQSPEAYSCELRASVRVKDQPWWWAASHQSAAQRLAREVGIE